jgi:hypothetical protein
MTRATAHKWSQQVTDHSNALDLKQGVFKLKDPKRIAASLKDSAEHSERRHSDPYRSAMSMLTFYINRAGAQLQPEDKSKLERRRKNCASCITSPNQARRRRWGARWRSRGVTSKVVRAVRPMRPSTTGSTRISS